MTYNVSSGTLNTTIPYHNTIPYQESVVGGRALTVKVFSYGRQMAYLDTLITCWPGRGLERIVEYHLSYMARLLEKLEFKPKATIQKPDSKYRQVSES